MYLFIFLISIMTFIMYMMFTIKVSNTDYMIESLILSRNLEAKTSAVRTTQRTIATGNDAFYQKGIIQIVAELKRELSSKRYRYTTSVNLV